MIHLIVGNTGSGKTTYSNTLRKKTKGVIFSIDQWNNILFLKDKVTKSTANYKPNFLDVILSLSH